MVHEKGAYRRYTRMGPGGKRCSCCFPPPGPQRKLEFKITKRRERAEVKKLVAYELEGIACDETQTKARRFAV